MVLFSSWCSCMPGGGGSTIAVLLVGCSPSQNQAEGEWQCRFECGVWCRAISWWLEETFGWWWRLATNSFLHTGTDIQQQWSFKTFALWASQVEIVHRSIHLVANPKHTCHFKATTNLKTEPSILDLNSHFHCCVWSGFFFSSNCAQDLLFSAGSSFSLQKQWKRSPPFCNWCNRQRKQNVCRQWQHVPCFIVWTTTWLVRSGTTMKTNICCVLVAGAAEQKARVHCCCLEQKKEINLVLDLTHKRNGLRFINNNLAIATSWGNNKMSPTTFVVRHSIVVQCYGM